MPSCKNLYAGLALCMAAGVPLGSQADLPPSPEKSSIAEIQSLISQLGAPRFSSRKSASEKLARIGLPAYHALEDATRDGDRETRYRAEKVLALIRQNDLNRRLTVFLASLDSAEDQALPSWTRFKTTHGNSTASRTLFVEMQRAEGELLASLEADPRQATERLGKRAVEYSLDQQARAVREGPAIQLSLGQIASLIFVAGQSDVRPSPQTLALILRLGNQTALREALVPGDKSQRHAADKAEISRRLLAAVIARSEDAAAYPAMQLAVEHELKEGLVPALKVLEGPGRVRYTVQYALILVARFGDESHLGIIEKLFTDHTLIGSSSQNRVRREIQVRDSALAAALLITKQELKDYFVLAEGPAATRVPSYSYLSLVSLGFENDEQRTAAFQKWETYKTTRKAAAPQKPPAAAPPGSK